MAYIYLTHRCGSRFAQGRVYEVSEDVAGELCEKPGPRDLTGGKPFARRLSDEVGDFLEEHDVEMTSNGVRPFGELAGYCADQHEPTDAERLEEAEKRARAARKDASSLQLENAALQKLVADLEERNAALEVQLATFEETSPVESGSKPAPVEEAPSRAAELDAKTVEELKAILDGASLSKTGNKGELISRILEHESGE